MLGQNSEKVALTTILQGLEVKHSVSFSYVANEVENLRIVPPEASLSLQESLIYLSQASPFDFSRIDDRYISVARKPDNLVRFCGTVQDGITKEPLEGATIQLNEGEVGVISDAQGNFSLKGQTESKRVTIQFLGYKPLVILSDVDSNNCETYFLMPSYARLNEVLLEQYFVKGIDRNYDGSTSIHTNDFGLLPGQTENDVLQMAQVLPGVESSNETISTINTRGGSNDETLILWEGNRMYQTGHFFGLISAFNPNLTQNVRIYKNGTPSHYGESVSGLIDISASDSLPKQLHGGAGINLINANAFLQVPISEKTGFQISSRSSINTILETPLYNTYAKRIFQDSEITNISSNQQSELVDAKEDFNFYDVGLKWFWNPSSKDKIRLNFLTINNALDFTETLVDEQQSKTSRLEQRSIVGGISWEHIWSSSVVTNSKIYSSYYLLEALNTDIFTSQELFQENEVLELGLQLNAKIKLSAPFKWNTGYHFSEIGITNTQDVNLPRFRDFEKDVLRTHSVHNSIDFENEDRTTLLSVGARLNYFDKFKETLVEPRFHLLQQVGYGFALEFSGEFKSQTATQRIDFESDFLGVEKRRWVLATEDDIPIKKSKQASVGIVFKKNNWFINLEGFYKRVEGITSKSQGFQNQFQFSNTIGNYDVKGLEFLINKKIKNFSGWLTYALNENNYQFDALEPSKFPNNIDIRHTAQLAGSYENNNFKLALGLNWRTGKPFTKPLTEESIIIENGIAQIQYQSPNTESLPDYLRLDTSAEYFWSLNNRFDLKINVALLNVLNKKNTLNIRYALKESDENITTVDRIEELSLGFSPNISVQLLF